MKHFFIFIILSLLLSSCISTEIITVQEYRTVKKTRPKTETRYKTVVDKEGYWNGNKFDIYKNKSKNYILQSLGAPERLMDDGNGGELLIYEDVEIKTEVNNNTSSSNSSYASASGYGSSVYGVGSSSSYGSSRTNISTKEVKKEVIFYINRNRICYNIKANYGNIWVPQKTHQESYKVTVNEEYYDKELVNVQHKQYCMKRASWWFVLLYPPISLPILIGLQIHYGSCK